jgi:hypothetical protein
VNLPSFLLAVCLLACTSLGHAFQVASLSPRGEVARINQVVVKFDDSAVNFGDPKAPAPLTLTCSDAQAALGSSRWLNDRQWAYDFERDLPPGVHCTVQLRPGLKSAKGADLTGTGSYTFNSGGPFVQDIRPNTEQRIDEEQFFVLQLNGAASLASLQANLWCSVEGLGERVAIRLIDGKDRAALLKSQGLEVQAASEPLRFVTLTCNRRLTPGAKIALVYGKGVATPGTAASAQAVANTVEKRFAFQVREPFTAGFSCERENAQSACLPLRPLRLSFNATPTSLPGSKRCSATTATRWTASRRARTSPARCPRCWTKTSTRTTCSRACCRCWRGRAVSRRWTCPSPPARTRARSRWWAFRCRRAFMWWRSHRKSWAPRCSMNAMARAHDVCAHLGAGHQPGRAFQAGPRKRAGLGHHAGQGQTGGQRHGARVGLPRQRTGQATTNAQGIASIEGLSPDPSRLQRATTMAKAAAPILSAPAMRRRGWRTWPSPGATGSGH